MLILPTFASVSKSLPSLKLLPCRGFFPVESRSVCTSGRLKLIARIGNTDYLVDGDGEVLAPLNGAEDALPFSMSGWDEAKTERAFKDNIERVRLYQKMLEQWKSFDLASRVRSVDLSDLRDAKAVTNDSGQLVTISLGHEDFGEHLRSGISAIVGKGDVFEGVDLRGVNMTLIPRQKKSDPAAK